MLDRNVVVAGGIPLYPPIKSKYFRVGHMRPINANEIISVVAAIERALIKLGYEAKAREWGFKNTRSTEGF